MQKLFVKPEHGNLGKVVEALRAEDFQVEIVGWGYPPMYVVADKAEHDEIKEIVQEIDGNATFEDYREDLIDEDQMLDVFNEFSLSNIEQVCVRLKEDYQSWYTQSGGDKASIASKIVRKYSQVNDLSAVVDAAVRTNEPLFLVAINRD